jgi:hypothetical protein
VSKILKKHFGFRYAPTQKVARMAAEIESCEAVAIHFRRGDLLSDKYRQIQTPVGESYYRQALMEIQTRMTSPKFFVFSDDLDFARSSGMCPESSVFVDCVEDWNPWDGIRLMSLCRHFIIANSSFSWWGAWLAENPSKVVIRPDPWFANMPENDTRDLCPEGWIALKR